MVDQFLNISSWSWAWLAGVLTSLTERYQPDREQSFLASFLARLLRACASSMHGRLRARWQHPLKEFAGEKANGKLAFELQFTDTDVIGLYLLCAVHHLLCIIWPLCSWPCNRVTGGDGLVHMLHMRRVEQTVGNQRVVYPLAPRLLSLRRIHR